ncbi:hypothetical protein [Amycolatopsis rubida]|uniref:hypothetical protein n=1 Tax=Amycolatopsis rubida TaxID=112413 RepID=UPI0011603DD2|nr:hypothetical protein [Amycolatopsis rubida]
MVIDKVRDLVFFEQVIEYFTALDEQSRFTVGILKVGFEQKPRVRNGLLKVRLTQAFCEVRTPVTVDDTTPANPDMRQESVLFHD